MTPTQTRPDKLLIVDDDARIRDLLKRYLSQEGKYERVGPVKLVLLDINMPGLNGFETLTLIRSNPDFSRVPVVLLSSTMAPAEIDRSYSLGGNSFLHKPTSLEVYVDQVRTLVQYWLHFAQLPSPIRRRNA